MASPTVERPQLDEATGRHFTLMDFMVLIAAIAVCLMATKAFRALMRPVVYQMYDVRQYTHVLGACWLLGASMALAALVVFVPKPGGRDRIRRPGALAMVMVALTWVYDMVQTAIQGGMLRLTTGQSFPDGMFWYLFGPIYHTSFRAGPAILAAWITLALLGQGRPEPNWLDRSGRLLGWVWVVWGLLAWVLEYETIV